MNHSTAERVPPGTDKSKEYKEEWIRNRDPEIPETPGSCSNFCHTLNSLSFSWPYFFLGKIE